MSAIRATARRRPAKLGDRLVLCEWMLGLFEVSSAESLLSDIAAAVGTDHTTREWLSAENVTLFHRRLTSRSERAAVSHTDLLRYDENIVRHWRRVTARPERQNLTLKHFQYLALLFTEVYLDRYFSDAESLLHDLNAFGEEWNKAREPQDWTEAFTRNSLNKLAFWMATGSGKTLLMHVNIWQYLHYLGAANQRSELNRILLLTPNDGLSRQHLDEFAASGMDARPFTKEGRSLFTGRTIEVIDIHKLAEEAKEKTVAVQAFEGKNLVLVDEGHRGASASEAGAWMERRRRLCEGGFSFEYSATFGQAIKPGGSTALLQEYGRAILFNYSYRYFHAEGFGKEFNILNLQEDRDKEQRRLYMTGGLLAFLQQLHLYREYRDELTAYLIEKPLWIFVGSRVTASTGRLELSDILQILEFLDDVLRDRDEAIERIAQIQRGSSGLVDSSGRDIFADRLAALFVERTPEAIYDEALELIFNAPGGGTLSAERLRGVDAEGEIALSVGGFETFGVINVGDASKVIRQAKLHGITISETGEFKDSLFRRINSQDSVINVLIGAKKFTEGWSSWRVSTIGLMNVGRSEGSEIIQLFGRGVRLRGLDFCLKRSDFVRRNDRIDHPKYIRQLETLNVFGIRADYMQQFREFLEDEGLSSDAEGGQMTLNILNRLAEGCDFEDARLFSIRLDSRVDFRVTGPAPVLEPEPHAQILRRPISIDWYPRIESRRSGGLNSDDGVALDKTSHPLTADHTAFFDFDEIWFELQRFKAEKSFYNLSIPRDVPRRLLGRADWYSLVIPANALEFTDFDRVRVWQEIAVALLKKYVQRYYRIRQAEYETNHLRYENLKPEDGNFFEHYTFEIPPNQDDIRATLIELQEDMERGIVRNMTRGPLQVLAFDRHLFAPLLYLSDDTIAVTPVALNAGERTFVEHMADFVENHSDELGEREIFLLRNQSRGRGVGFFESGGYYPDFILWVKDGARQHIAFVDPKGLNYLDGLTDPKIQLAETIKEYEERMRAQEFSVELDAFVISQTPIHQLRWAGDLSRADFEECHVLFQDEDDSRHIKRMFELMGELTDAS